MDNEAWTRKKPKKIVHNQRVIQFMIILAYGLPIPLGGLAVKFIFIIPYMPLYLLLAWTVGAVAYVSLYAYSAIKKQ